MKPERLCIATLDPHNRGGILALMRFVYEEAKRAKMNPFLAYNRVPGVRGERDLGVPGVRPENFEGMEGLAVERILPAFEFLNYITNRKAWRRVLAGADIFFGVCGNSLAALPLALARKRFSMWVASTLYEERVDRLAKESLARKIRDYFSLPILLFLEKKVFEKSEHVLALSAYTRDQIIARYPQSISKITVVPYPIDTDFFTPLTDAVTRTTELPRTILFAGRLGDERKNISLLIRSFAAAYTQNPDLKLVLVGGTLSAAHARLLKELNVESAVEVTGQVSQEELRKRYQQASLFVISSFQEGLCISGLEAMACGAPIISTMCGGPEEFVVHGENGYLVGNNDEKALTNAICHFFALPEESRSKMSLAARVTILKSYSRDRVWPVIHECLTMENNEDGLHYRD